MVQELLLGIFVGVVVSFLAIFLTKKLAMAEKTMEAERGTNPVATAARIIT